MGFYRVNVKTVDAETNKKKNVQLVFNGETYTDVEAQVNKEFEGSDFSVKNIAGYGIAEIIDNFKEAEEMPFYEATVEFTTYLDNGKEKKYRVKYLVHAGATDIALNQMEEFLKTSMDDTEVKAIKKTRIIEYHM